MVIVMIDEPFYDGTQQFWRSRCHQSIPSYKYTGLLRMILYSKFSIVHQLASADSLVLRATKTKVHMGLRKTTRE